MIIAIVFVLLSVWLASHIALRSQPLKEPFMVSHRGTAALAPENTIAAVKEAIDRGALYIEIDVQRTKDNVLVVMHDVTVDRTTNGTGRIGDLRWDQLSDLDAGSHFDERFANERIPTLDSILRLVMANNVRLILEAKVPSLYSGIEHQILEAILRHGLERDVYIVSFDHDWLAKFHALAPQIRIGYLSLWVCSLRRPSQDSFEDVYWLGVVLNPTLLWRAHRHGEEVVVWTPNSIWQMRLLAWLGVDGVTTDRPDLWIQLAQATL